MGLSFLTPLFLAGFLALAVPIAIHLIRRHQGTRQSFPSLMFLRRLPVDSVRRRKIRNWPLLLLRAGALALIVLAFSRPTIQLGSTEAGPTGDGLREVLIVMDRSWSMSSGDRWERATETAREILGELVTPDRVSLVLFDREGRVAVGPTLNPGQIHAVLDTLRPGWGGTRLGAGIQTSQGILQASDRSRKEVHFISDFQRRGWEGGPQERLPAGTSFLPADVGDDGLGSLVVSDVELEHDFLDGRQRLQPLARVIRQEGEAPSGGDVIFEANGRELETGRVDFESAGAQPVTFEPVTLTGEDLRASVQLRPDEGEADVPFRFVFSPREILTVLLIGETGSGVSYVENALSIGGQLPMSVVRRSGFDTADLSQADIVILNDAPLPSGGAGEALREHVQEGGGLVVIAGPASSPANWETAWEDFLPGLPGAPVDRDPTRGASLTQVDRDHPIFAALVGPAGIPISGPRFYRYRSLEFATDETPAPAQSGSSEAEAPETVTSDGVIARFDDGTPALAERSVGEGRVLLWTSTFDTSWTNITLHPVFVPLVREIVTFASGRREATPYFTVGSVLDTDFLLESGSLEPLEEGILIGPGGVGIDLERGGGAIQFATPGFYEVRTGGDNATTVGTFAVNPDVGEADPIRMDPEEMAVAVSPVQNGTEEGTSDQATALGAVDQGALLRESERRQGAWRFLILAALLLLLSEAFVAARTRPLANEGLNE